ncbi:LuxR C-terminal-related transcriptional regulator [Sphaerimonospora cavernae]|uniref:LuxR C-terminal-related transcriptional regulator n=1 Tax=Sphaerimonospora cavernae TaxID=1740611 RepID=A0ABV6U0A5_9ACTN
MLESLGLDAIAENLYRAMLQCPEDDLATIGARLQISDTRLREALDQLHEMSLVRPASGVAAQYRPVHPEVGIGALIERRRLRIQQELHRVEAARSAADELVVDLAMTATERPGRSGIRHLEDLAEIREQLGLLSREVRYELMALVPGGGQSEDNRAAARPQDKALLARGVRMRTLYVDSFLACSASVTYAKWLVERGAEVRTTPVLPIRMTIMDRSMAIIPVDPHNSADGALLLTNRGVLTALCELFTLFWRDARALEAHEQRSRDDRGLSQQEAAVLQLLAEGYTDEVIAKRLGVSPRTARRVAAELMARLEARSRFQAGIRAAARGWLTGEE